MPLETKVTKKENYSYSVELTGAIDTDTSPQLKTELTEIIDEKTNVVVLDMAGVDYVSSAGLGLIVWAKKTLSKKDASFVMVNLQPQIKKLIDLMNLDMGFKIRDASEEDKYIDQIIKSELEKKDT
jgi:anti-anti-sigma factor